MSAASVQQARGQAPAEHELNRRDKLDPYTRFLYVPRTVTALLAGATLQHVALRACAGHAMAKHVDRASFDCVHSSWSPRCMLR